MSIQKVRQNGFTLIELMITVVMVAILASIALPNYNEYVIRSNRTAAQSEMMDIANREQQFMLADRGYADKTTLESSGYTLPTGVAAKYTYTVTVNNAATPPTFTITFTPTGSQTVDGVLTLDGQGVKTPATKWR